MAASTMIKKTFADTMKEQDWINDMSAQGKALIGYSGGTYAFVDDEPGSWQYLVEIMGTGKKAQEDYLSFLEEMGVEVVASYAGRAYLRKKNDGTPFDLHSDGESRLDQAKKAATTWTAIPITQAVTAMAIICNSLLTTGSFTLGTGIAVGTGIVLLVAAVIEYAVLGAPGRKRVREAQRDLQVHE